MFKHFTIFLILLLTISNSYSQVKCNTALIQQLQQRQDPSHRMDLLVQFKPGQTQVLKKIPSLDIKYVVKNIASVNITIADILKLTSDPDIMYMEYIKPHVQKMNDTMLVRNRITAVRAGMAPLLQGYDGTGIVIGLIDSGIDYHHPDFQTASGKTRIKHIWDMTMPTATNTPTAFNYGQEWDSTAIDQGNCTHTGTAEWGHGTHVTGIAAGNGNAINHYEGVAPKADIIMVALDFNRPGPTIADAVQYIATKAQAMGKPFVINASVGDYYGSHDGTDMEAQMIDGLISNIPGRVLVGAAGNAGSSPIHLGYTVTPVDTNFTWLSNTTAQLDYWLYADTNNIKNVKYSVGVNSPNYNNLGRMPFKNYNYGLATLKRDTIYHNTNRIGIIESSASVNSFGVYELYLSIKADSTGYLWRMENTGSGKFDAWNFDFVTGGLPSVIQYPNILKYKIADTLATLCSSFQCSTEIITVGNYVNRNKFIDVNGAAQTSTETPGQIAASSSTGPTRDFRIKPDVAASGASSISCGVLSLLPNLISVAPYDVAQGGYHVVDGGTSSSCPVVAGLAALYLQEHPTATNQQIKAAIMNCTYTDQYTGTSLPNYRWGYGKLDGYRAMTCNMNTVGIKAFNVDESGMVVFPNPAKNTLQIKFSGPKNRTVKLYDLLGNVIVSGVAQTEEMSMNISNVSAGAYIVEVNSGNQVARKKVIVE